MCEANYPYVQLQMGFGKSIWLAQIFTPRETHDIEYVSLKLEPFLYVDYVEIAIQYVLAGTPTGVDLVTDRIHWVTLDKYPLNKTILFRFRPTFHLVATIPYAIILRVPTAIGGRLVKATYEAPPGHYPRGKLIKSNNAGSTWDTTDLGDLFFAEWGDPPVSPSPPPPPLENFAIPAITYTHWDIGLVIRIPTNVPCHLTCYYTDKKPLKHHTSRTIRGLSVPWGTYFCFVAWKEIEQSEYSSTLYHTFHIPDWLEGQTKWFTFRGEVDTLTIPSVGPIFKHTHPGGLPQHVILRPHAPGDLCSIPNEIGDPCPNHWKNVDDEEPDEDATYIWNGFGWTSYFSDLYNLPTATLDKINSLRVYARVKRIGGYAYAFSAYILIKTHGIIYQSTHYASCGTAWSMRIHTWYNNPFTNEPWTQAEIDNLQIGIKLRYYLGVGWSTASACTQLYATVTRGIEGGPD